MPVLRLWKHCREELVCLRDIHRSTPLEEALRWGTPGYPHKGEAVGNTFLDFEDEVTIPARFTANEKGRRALFGH